MNFEFATATRIVFGAGRLSELGAQAKGFGQRVLLVTGKGAWRAIRASELLESAGFSVTVFAVSGEPTTALVEQGMSVAREADCELVVAMGGGSVIDAGKPSRRC
jgi:alcohol dehydrogenase class IV